MLRLMVCVPQLGGYKEIFSSDKTRCNDIPNAKSDLSQ